MTKIVVDLVVQELNSNKSKSKSKRDVLYDAI